MVTPSIVPVIQAAVKGKSGMGANKKAPKGHAVPGLSSGLKGGTHKASSNLALAPSKGLTIGDSRKPTKRK